MKKKVNQLFKSVFVRNVLIMATGAVGAQAVTLILSPFITRLYGPEAFGIMGTFKAIMNTIIPISALTYPIAIVLPKSDQNAKGLIRLSLSISVGLSVLALIILMLFNRQIAIIFNLNKVSFYLYLIPFVVILSGLMQSVEQWLIRTKQFAINARATFYQSIFTYGGQAGIGFFYPNPAILVILTAFNNGIKALLMIIFSRKSSYVEDERKLKEENESIKRLAKKYYDFPLYRAPETFINAISQGTPVLMLTVFFGPAAAGFYTIGRTTLSIPGRLIGKAVGDVFYPRIAQAADNKENMKAMIKKATFLLGLIGFLPFGIVIFFGPYLFSFVFGSDWITAGEYARWIALWTYVGFMNRPSVRSLPVLNAQRFHLIYTIIMLITRIIALALGYYIFSSDLVAVALFGISGAILNIGLIFITLKLSEKNDGSNLR